MNRPAQRRRPRIIAVAVVGALGLNLIIYALGRAAGASFSYTQSGTKTSVDALAVGIMTTGPLTAGLVLVGLLSRRWPSGYRVATIAAPVLAVGTIGLMTIPAGFDTASTCYLSAMHLALIPISLLALAALAHTDSEHRDAGRVDAERR